ncbi:hypothetical protein PHYBLDRAFT_141427 [Phycomyces blakesleeanus NRRL 1555(-)]|uniref:Uncharacterized protein n=1 Tax=Phycomyces blakesleeanus (strain ATCC 8743b / DSM 1359 / FGSC 10004 / NBRC 33097 / NRRL 1555) TaxID=763407 RepID=A0A162PZV2_PHYB8|nr:hypothetical protein PHYBLDRAFT_141427 [Phycomyces blakesleeanus NRRL 1555(-)]OAD77547.1 hypothetical protein PHYBLDRAFT_141427 [Phycomyces blakesleeanus NRRL 1555(-)]|eukprot:XP_018295587.1 hypothetical protein PHYBLDRAFT_141427 [Phycomyces blakesleeanus NRRL 1555(-)]
MAFPLIAPVDSEGKVYRGFLSIHNVDYSIEIHLPDRLHKQNLAIFGEPTLQSLVKDKEDLIQKKIGQCEDINLLLTDLKEILETQAAVNTTTNFSAERYVVLLNELDILGFDVVKDMSDIMDQITFEDQSNRTHQIRAHIPTDYPLTAPTLTIDLPCSPPALLSTSLSDHIHHIYSLVSNYKDFFDCMDELDVHCRILDPDNPRTGDSWRRVALSHHCSVHIDINPDAPRDIPRARFFGAEKRSGELRIAWQQGSHAWDTSQTLFVNMKQILKDALVDLTKPQEESNHNEVECGICYAYKLDQSVQETPDWLRSSPASTRSFNVLFGKCPYCGEWFCDYEM